MTTLPYVNLSNRGYKELNVFNRPCILLKTLLAGLC